MSGGIKLFVNILTFPLNIILLISCIPILLFQGINQVVFFPFKMFQYIPYFSAVLQSIDNQFRKTARLVLKDDRDVPICMQAVYMTPLIIGSFLWQAIVPGLVWYLAILHYCLLFGPGSLDFYSKVFACKHLEGHRVQGLYKHPFSIVFNRYFEWFLGIFYGNIPELDRCGHVGIHHSENGGFDDTISTLKYDRSSLRDFSRYLLLNAYWQNSSIGPLVFFFKTKRRKLFKNMLRGAIVYYGLIAALMWIDWSFALLYLVLPHTMNNAISGIVGWTWHCFANPENPESSYGNTLTIVDGERDFLNENYHLAHHLNPAMHWSDGQSHLERHRDRYVAEGSTIFRQIDLIQIFMLTTVFTRFDRLAQYYVDLTEDLSPADTAQLLEQRTAPQVSPSVFA